MSQFCAILTPPKTDNFHTSKLRWWAACVEPTKLKRAKTEHGFLGIIWAWPPKTWNPTFEQRIVKNRFGNSKVNDSRKHWFWHWSKITSWLFGKGIWKMQNELTCETLQKISNGHLETLATRWVDPIFTNFASITHPLASKGWMHAFSFLLGGFGGGTCDEGCAQGGQVLGFQS